MRAEKQRYNNGKKKRRKTEINSKFESQCKDQEKPNTHKERNELKRKAKLRRTVCHWLSSLRGRLRQAHGPSSESQSHRADEFGHY